jgi:GT2 family glycosyltransferase
MFSEPLVAIIIVHWGSPRITMECVTSIRSSNYGNLRIIVVDNCSEQRLWRDPLEVDHEITYIQSETNLGYAEGNNIGILRALSFRARYILVLNNDVVIDRQFLNICINYLENQPDISVISPKVLFYHSSQYIDGAGGELDVNTGRITMFGREERDIGQFDTAREITFVAGSAFIARANIFKQIGLFDEKLFCYCEDVDLSRRILLAGMKMWYLPEARVWHKHLTFKVGNRKNLPSRTNVYYFWRNQTHNLNKYISKDLIKEYIRYSFNFMRSVGSFAIKHRRPDLSLSMIVGLFDSISGRMGKREYVFLRYEKKDSSDACCC